MALADYPRYPLTVGPSPVHPLERLTQHLGGAQIWAKREDCSGRVAADLGGARQAAAGTSASRSRRARAARVRLAWIARRSRAVPVTIL